MSIYPEDFETLGRLRTDLLVAREGPASSFLLGSRGEQMGFAVIEKAVRRLDARWIIHGHHHRAYEADLGGGLRARGLGLGEVWRLP